MKEECLICKAPLEYLEREELMECAICRKKENSRTRCANGHYVCDECHTKGLDSILGLCLAERLKDPIAIVEKMMDMPFCHMHGPEHHVMVGCALLTACKNAGGEVDLPAALAEMMSRGKKVPGGACGFWGACGAGVGAGMFVSVFTKATPLTTDSWGLSNLMTSKALGEIGTVGGPRCCKRNSFLAILAAVDFMKEHFGIEMEKPGVVCTYSASNGQCIAERCPFWKTARYGYDAVLCETADDGGAYVAFPWDLKKECGKGRMKVHAEFDGVPYDGSIVNMGLKNPDGTVCYVIGVPKSVRTALKKGDGDTIRVEITERKETDRK